MARRERAAGFQEESVNESNSLDASAISVDNTGSNFNKLPAQMPSSRSVANLAAKSLPKLAKADSEANMDDAMIEANEEDSKSSKKSNKLASKSVRTTWLQKMSWIARRALASHVQLNADDMVFMGGFEMWCNEILAERAFVIKRVWNWKIDHSKYFLDLTKDDAWKLFSEEIGDLLRHSIQILRWFEEFDKLDNARKRLLIIKHAPVLCGLIASMQYNSSPCRYVVYKAERMLGPWIRPLLEQYGEISELVCQVLRDGLERLSELDLHFVELALYGCYIVFSEMESTTTASRLKRLLVRRLTKQENEEQKILDQIHASCQSFRSFEHLHKKALGVYLAKKPKKIVLDKAYLDVLWTNGDVEDDDNELDEENDDCQDDEKNVDEAEKGKSSLFKEDEKIKQKEKMQKFTAIIDSTTEVVETRSKQGLRTSHQGSNETVEKASIMDEAENSISTKTDTGLTLENSEDEKKSKDVAITNAGPEFLISADNEPEVETLTSSNIPSCSKSVLEDLIERKPDEATISGTNETILTVSKRFENETEKHSLGREKYVTEALSCKKLESGIPITSTSNLRPLMEDASEMNGPIKRKTLYTSSGKKLDFRASTCDNPEMGSSNVHAAKLSDSLAGKTKIKNSKRGRPKRSRYKAANRVNAHSKTGTSVKNRSHEKSYSCSNRKGTKDEDEANVEIKVDDDSAVTVSTADLTGLEGPLNNQSEAVTSRDGEEHSNGNKINVSTSGSDILTSSASKLGKTKAFELPSSNRVEADDSVEDNNLEGGISVGDIPGNEISNGKRLELRALTHNESEIRAIMDSEVDASSSNAFKVAAISNTPEIVTSVHDGIQNGLMIGLGVEDKTLASNEVSTEISARGTSWIAVTPETSTLIQSKTNITTGEVLRDGTTSETEGKEVEGKTTSTLGSKTVAQESESSAVLLHTRTTEGTSETPNLLENSLMGMSAFQTVPKESNSSQRTFQSQNMVSFAQIQTIPTVSGLQPDAQLASSVFREMPLAMPLTSESRTASPSASVLPYEGFTLIPSTSGLLQLNFMPVYGLQQWHSPSQIVQIHDMSGIQPPLLSSFQETPPVATPDQDITDNTPKD